MSNHRQAHVERRTGETAVQLAINLDHRSKTHIDTGLPFFDHMLAQTARHGQFSVHLTATGDLQVDAHHTIEDCGIALGNGIRQCLGDKIGLARFGYSYALLDESLARVVVDLAGRAHLSYQATLSRAYIGSIDSDLFREFFQAVVNHAQIGLHIDLLRGCNAHHQVEAIFKACGLALKAAWTITDHKDIPSTKGVL